MKSGRRSKWIANELNCTNKKKRDRLKHVRNETESIYSNRCDNQSLRVEFKQLFLWLDQRDRWWCKLIGSHLLCCGHCCGKRAGLFVDVFERLVQKVLNGSECGDNCRRSESVGNQRKVRQTALHRSVQNAGRSTVAQRRPVVIKQINKFLHDLSSKKKKKKNTH